VSSPQIGNVVDSCVEHGIWTTVPTPPPDSLHAFTLKLDEVDPAENDDLSAHLLVEDSA
jgi:hypothetical protein